ncbi:Leucine-rich repeat protein kinase family protein, partial [Prunus dulcis]
GYPQAVNRGTNSQPARTIDTLKTRTSVTSPTRADYPIKGLQQHPVKDAPSISSLRIQVPKQGRLQNTGLRHEFHKV